MTETLYTNADVETAVAAIARAWGYDSVAAMEAVPDLEGPRARADARAVLDALTAAGWRKLGTAGICGDTAPTLALIASPTVTHCTLTAGHTGWHQDDDGARWTHGPGGLAGVVPAPTQLDRSHEIAFDDDGTWSIGHPDGCPGQLAGDCDVARLATAQVTRGLATIMAGGRYTCSVNQEHNVFQLDAPAGETHHVLSVANDGAWEITHPASCTVHTPTGPAVICLVHDLATEQLPADATGLRAGRYECAVNDLGDRFLLGDRIEEATDPAEVHDFLDDITRQFADADTSTERVEVIRDLLEGWYARWPATAVTDEHDGLARHLVSLVCAAEATIGTRSAEQGDEPLPDVTHGLDARTAGPYLHAPAAASAPAARAQEG